MNRIIDAEGLKHPRRSLLERFLRFCTRPCGKTKGWIVGAAGRIAGRITVRAGTELRGITGPVGRRPGAVAGTIGPTC